MDNKQQLLELVPVSVPHGFEEAIDYRGIQNRPRWLGCFPQHNYKHLRLVDSSDHSEYGNYESWSLFAEHAINRISTPSPVLANGKTPKPIRTMTLSKPQPLVTLDSDNPSHSIAYLLDRQTRLLFRGEVETIEKYLKHPQSLELLSSLYCQAFSSPQYLPVPGLEVLSTSAPSPDLLDSSSNSHKPERFEWVGEILTVLGALGVLGLATMGLVSLLLITPFEPSKPAATPKTPKAQSSKLLPELEAEKAFRRQIQQ